LAAGHRSAQDARLQDEADQAAADAAKIAEEERLEAEKKKPKLGDWDVTSAPPSFVESPISAFAISDEYFGKRRAKLISETTQAL
jgi:hypothetical protein